MSHLRRTILAAAVIGTGLAATTGTALAGEGHDGHHGHESHGTQQHGLLNVNDVQTIVPINLCNNDVPINALGLQIPLQDIAANIPLLSPADHHSGSAGEVSKSCENPVAARN